MSENGKGRWWKASDEFPDESGSVTGSDAEVTKARREQRALAVRRLKLHEEGFVVLLRSDKPPDQISYQVIIGLEADPDRPGMGLVEEIENIKGILDEAVRTEVRKMGLPNLLAEWLRDRGKEE